MSGHSKWHNIQRKKSITDSKRANIFTKLAKNITVAARLGGGDPTFNFRLRVAIDAAKTANMPNDNIERAIKRGTGELEGQQIEEIVYEGFGPGKIAFIIKALTDNKNRTVSDVKHLFTKAGGNMGAQNSVMWMFDQKGIIIVSNEHLPKKDKDNIELEIIELGPEDLVWEEDNLKIITAPENLQKVKEGLEKLEIETDYANLDYIPKETVTIEDQKTLEQIEKFTDALEEHEDIDDYYSNQE